MPNMSLLEPISENLLFAVFVLILHIDDDYVEGN